MTEAQRRPRPVGWESRAIFLTLSKGTLGDCGLTVETSLCGFDCIACMSYVRPSDELMRWSLLHSAHSPNGTKMSQTVGHPTGIQYTQAPVC